VQSRKLSRWAIPLALLPVVAAGSLLILIPGGDPDVSRRPAPAPIPILDRLTLDDGQLLEGELLGQGPEYLRFRLPSGSVRLVPSARVRFLERGSQAKGEQVSVTLRNQKVIQGVLLKRSPQWIELRLTSGTQVTLRQADIASVESLY
jgi:hypothetical protein